MLKIALLLLIAAGLAIFTLQNLSPIALVVLGVRTVALPLAVWVIGALIAGAVTSIVLAGLINLAARSVNRTQRATAPRSPWSAAGDRPETTRPPAASRTDDWGAVKQDDWESWDEPSEPRRSPNSSRTDRPEPRDRAVSAQQNWGGYEDQSPDRRPPINIPRRTNFETPQAPKTQRPSGSAYARRDSEPRKPQPEKDVYDAEYRVIIPPYQPTPEPIAPPPTPTPAPAAEDDDWDLGDLLDDVKPSDRS